MEKIVSFLLWGATAGALACGRLSARFGRKRTLLAAALIFIVGWIHGFDVSALPNLPAPPAPAAAPPP